MFKTKLESDGSVDRYKARHVIKDYLQPYRVDYFETYSSVYRYETIRAILAVAAEQNLSMKQLDVKTAYVHGNLEEIYMNQLEGFISSENPNYVWKLKKSFYDLKKALWCWNHKFLEKMKQKDMI